jgi:hypothetical protein
MRISKGKMEVHVDSYFEEDLLPIFGIIYLVIACDIGVNWLSLGYHADKSIVLLPHK